MYPKSIGHKVVLSGQNCQLVGSKMRANVHEGWAKIDATYVYQVKHSAPQNISLEVPRDNLLVEEVSVTYDKKNLRVFALLKSEVKGRSNTSTEMENVKPDTPDKATTRNIIEVLLNDVPQGNITPVEITVSITYSKVEVPAGAKAWGLVFLPPPPGSAVACWDWKATLHTKSIKEINSPSHELASTKDDNGLDVLSISDCESNPQSRPLVVAFETGKEDCASVALTKTMTNSGLWGYVATLQFIPAFSAFFDPAKIRELNQMATFAEYVFILDRSGSMGSNKRIFQATNTLTLILKSLPQNSYFNIIGYGSSLDPYPKSLEYTQANVDHACQVLAKTRADLGENDELMALKHAIGLPKIPNYQRMIYLVTDGGVGNPQGIISYVEDVVNRDQAVRVYTVGIDCSGYRNFITKCAAAGRGKYMFVDDRECNVQSYVMSLLSESLTPTLSDFEVKYDSTYVKGIAPLYDRNSIVYRWEVVRMSANIDASLGSGTTNVDVSYFDSVKGARNSVRFEISLFDVVESTYGFMGFLHSKDTSRTRNYLDTTYRVANEIFEQTRLWTSLNSHIGAFWSNPCAVSQPDLSKLVREAPSDPVHTKKFVYKEAEGSRTNITQHSDFNQSPFSLTAPTRGAKVARRLERRGTIDAVQIFIRSANIQGKWIYTPALFPHLGIDEQAFQRRKSSLGGKYTDDDIFTLICSEYLKSQDAHTAQEVLVKSQLYLKLIGLAEKSSDTESSTVSMSEGSPPQIQFRLDLTTPKRTPVTLVVQKKPILGEMMVIKVKAILMLLTKTMGSFKDAGRWREDGILEISLQKEQQLILFCSFLFMLLFRCLF